MLENTFSQFNQQVANFGPKIPGIIFSFAVGYLLIKILAGSLGRALKIAKVPKALSNILVSLAVIILWFVLFSELAREAGFSSLAAKISGSLVLLGFAIANGISTLANDITSGIFLAKDNNFECGMRIKTGDIEGVVEKTDIRKTTIKGDKGEIFIVPNSRIDQGGWTVLVEKS